jgi:hypothetical protein
MRKSIVKVWFVGFALVLGCSFALAEEIYVSPTGQPWADGTRRNPLDIGTALSIASPARPGDTIYLMRGRYDGPTDGTRRLPFYCEVSGQPSNPVRIMPVPGESAHINGTVQLRSSYAEYINLEIGDLEWDPTGQAHQNDAAIAARGGTDVSFINCNIFGGSAGTNTPRETANLRFYGCLVHDFGSMNADGSGSESGHAFFTQTDTGTMVVERNMAWRGGGWNFMAYSQWLPIAGFDLVENIMFIPGSLKPGQTVDNYFVASYKPSDRVRMIGNVGYEASDVQQWRPNMRFSHYKPVQNGTAEIRDNYLMGAHYGVSLGNSANCTFAGNTVWSTGVLVEVNSAPTGSGLPKQGFRPDPANYRIDGNTYIANGWDKPFYYADTEDIDPSQQMSLAEWQSLGFDTQSRIVPGKSGRPTGTKVFVFANQYEPGRANVGVFCWNAALHVVYVDLSSALRRGQKYRVYNCLDIKQTLAQAKPVAEGKYKGGVVAFPLRKARISPDFDAFLVMPVKTK